MHMSFRNSKIVYYGPHACENCGVNIAKMGFEWGGNAFTYPEGPIYPNTEWHPHVCNPATAKRRELTLSDPLPTSPSGEQPLCGLCGKPMPEGEDMFNYHGYSGPCPQ